MGKETERHKYIRLEAIIDKLYQSENVNRRHELIKEYSEITNNILTTFSDRNLKGIQLEKEGNVDEAIKLYEKNVSEEFDGSHPYERLAIIYKRKGLIDEEIKILKTAKDRIDRGILMMREEKVDRRLEKCLKRR